MNADVPHESLKPCGARTRKGTACKLIPGEMCVGGRCKFHGGRSLHGTAHPNFKHGLYSKHRTFFMDDTEFRERQRRKLELVRKREDAYVYPKLQEWLDQREGMYNLNLALALDRKLRREYQAKCAARREAYRARKARDGGQLRRTSA